MESLNQSSILGIIIIIGIGIYLLIKLISKGQLTKPTSKKTSKNLDQDFSAFDNNPDKFNSSLEVNTNQSLEEIEESNENEYTITGDIYKLEEFLNMVVLVNEDYIQISLSELDDLFIFIEKDKEKGLIAYVYFAEDLNISYGKWAIRIKEIIWEYRFESEEEIDDREKSFNIPLGNKSLSTFADFIKKIIKVGYAEYAEKKLLLEFNHN